MIASTSPGGVPGDSGGSSTRPTLKITLLGSAWNSSAGGLSTFNRELAIHLSQHSEVDVTFLVPEGACKDEEKNEARSYGVNVVDAKCQVGLDPLYWLSCPPKDLHIDIVIGHGVKLGPQVQVIRNSVQYGNCKWVQVVHTAPEDLSKFKSYSDPTFKGESKHQVEVDLCKRADLVVPVGPRLTESYSANLRRWKKGKDIFSFTPGLFEREFGDLEQVANYNEVFKVVIVGRGDTEDFELKGLDIAAKAFTDQRLKEKPYKLIFVGASKEKQEEVRERLLRCGIAAKQLTVRRFVQSRDRLKDLLCEADLAIMPSKSEGFGLVAVEALSAGLPILVGSESGFAKALEVVVHGDACVVHSDHPAEWAKAIENVRSRHAMRIKEILTVKASYREMYSWKEQCEALVERMWQMVQGNENTNMPKCDAPVEKLEVACRTSKQQHPFDEKGKTLGTNEAESSSRKEPLENCWPSLSESTPDLETSNDLSKCDFPLEKPEAAGKTSVQHHVFYQKRKALGRKKDKTSSRTEPSLNWCKPSMSDEITRREKTHGSSARQLSRAFQNSMAATNVPKRDAIIAIDFGTTYSGFGYVFTNASEDHIYIFEKWGRGQGMTYRKTPTAVLLTEKGELFKFGHAAVDMYARQAISKKDCKKFLYFDKIKLLLHSKQDLNENTEVEARNGKKWPALDVFAKCLQYLKTVATDVVNERYHKDNPGAEVMYKLEDSQIQWVITIPVIWSISAKEFMRKAAYKAGIASPEDPDQLILALEPEAASYYCRKLLFSGFKGHWGDSRVVKETLDREKFPYMVVNNGGGTLDITVHEVDAVDGHILEKHCPSGGLFGGIHVDREFENLMSTAFDEFFMRKFKENFPNDWHAIMNHFETHKRAEQDIDNDEISIPLPFSFIRSCNQEIGSDDDVNNRIRRFYKDQVNVMSDYLNISMKTLGDLHYPVVTKIADHIHELLAKDSLRDVRTMFLVGGFSEAQFLQNEISRRFKGKRILIPCDPELAIIYGAVEFAKDPSLLRARVMGRTYGVNT